MSHRTLLLAAVLLVTAPQLRAQAAGAPPPAFRLTASEYFKHEGAEVMAFQDIYPEGHQGDVSIVEQRVRVASNGDLRLEPTPGQWQPVPVQRRRVVDRARNEIVTSLAYPDTSKDRHGFNPILYPALDLGTQHMESRAALADTLRHALRDETIGPWYPRAVDRDSGGFLSQFDYRWEPTGPQDKMIVTQARHVWTTARAAQFFPNDTIFLAASAHGFLFLRDKMWDHAQGGFFWLVTRGGIPKEDAPGRMVKQAYGNAFGIYALAGYYDVAHDARALRLAQDAFHWLDAHAHDPVYGGYFNYMERDGTPLRAGYRNDPPKDQNSSIHLLEAFTELYRVWPDSVLRLRLAEMLTLIRDTMRTDPGYLQLFFTEKLTPVSYRDSAESVRARHHSLDHVSFGHDIETAYLMLEASEALGRQHDTTTERIAKQMVDHALRNGYDAAVGGFYDEGYYFKDKPGITITYPTKNWWAQAEGLNTLLMMADRYPNDPLGYRARFLQQWSYIDANLIDHEHGGWYQGGLDREPQQRTALKGYIWKAAYHDGRALMNVIRRLEGGP